MMLWLKYTIDQQAVIRSSCPEAFYKKAILKN